MDPLFVAANELSRRMYGRVVYVCVEHAFNVMYWDEMVRGEVTYPSLGNRGRDLRYQDAKRAYESQNPARVHAVRVELMMHNIL